MPAWSQPVKSWEEIEQLSKKEQRTFFQQALQNREPIKKFSDIKRGDHLVRKGSMCCKAYDHHFLCVESISESGRLTIIHYFNTPSGASSRCISTSSFGSGASLGEVARVQEVTLPHEDFIKSESDLQEKGAEVERVVWPKELRRYSADEIIKRARVRKNETYYDVVKNNCESFVMWSMCDINFSLQSATTFVKTVCECFKGVMMSLCQVCKSLADIVECVKQALDWLWPDVIESFEIGRNYGVILALIVDLGWFAYSIWRAYRQWDEGVLIKTRLEFIEKVVDEIIVHFVQIFLPNLLWSLCGYFFSKGVSYLFSESIASAVEAWCSASHDQNHIAGIPGGEESLSQLPISSSP